MFGCGTDKLWELKKQIERKKTNHKNNTYYIFLGINTINNKVSSIYLYLYLGVVQLVHQISAAGPSVTIELAVTKL